MHANEQPWCCGQFTSRPATSNDVDAIVALHMAIGRGRPRSKEIDHSHECAKLHGTAGCQAIMERLCINEPGGSM